MSTSTLDHAVSPVVSPHPTLADDGAGGLLGVGDAGLVLRTVTDLADRIHQTIQKISACLLAELERLEVNVEPQVASAGYQRARDGEGPDAVLAIIESHYWVDRAAGLAPHLYAALNQATLALSALPEQL